MKNEASKPNPLKFLARHKFKGLALAFAILASPFLTLLTQARYKEGQVKWLSDKRLGSLGKQFKQQLLQSHRHREQPGRVTLRSPGSALFSLPGGTLVVSECMRRELGPLLADFAEHEQKRIQEGVLHKDLGLRTVRGPIQSVPN